MTLHEKVVLSAYTGILMCDMSEVHKYIEKLLGRSVWTHELASETLWKTIDPHRRGRVPHLYRR